MVEIIRLHNDPHQQTQTLLPWYANGSLDPKEAAEVGAHLAECAQCRADLKLEYAIAEGVANLPLDVEHGWKALRERVLSQAQTNVEPLRPRRTGFLGRPVPMGWALAAQAASLAVIVGLAWMAMPHTRPLYRTLGSAPAPASGNLVVIFKPATTEQDLRTAMLGSDARIVDGPTASNAYVLHVAPAERGQALVRLKADAHVDVAEPIDGDTGP